MHQHPKEVPPPTKATAHFDFRNLTDSDCRLGFVTKASCSLFSSSTTASIRLCWFRGDTADRKFETKPASEVFSPFRQAAYFGDPGLARSGIGDKSLVFAFFFCLNKVPLAVPDHLLLRTCGRTTKKGADELEGFCSTHYWCSASADWLRPFHSCGT